MTADMQGSLQCCPRSAQTSLCGGLSDIYAMLRDLNKGKNARDVMMSWFVGKRQQFLSRCVIHCSATSSKNRTLLPLKKIYFIRKF